MEKVSAFVHIELVHPDPDAAAQFMIEVLGAEIVEKQLSAYFESRRPGGRIIHVRTGKVVFQFVKPVESLTSWRRQYENSGPGVHNVTLQINGLEDVVADMLARGATQIARFEPDLREGGIAADGPITSYIIDASEQAALRFEMIETLPAWVSGEAP